MRRTLAILIVTHVLAACVSPAGRPAEDASVPAPDASSPGDGGARDGGTAATDAGGSTLTDAGMPGLTCPSACVPGEVCAYDPGCGAPTTSCQSPRGEIFVCGCDGTSTTISTPALTPYAHEGACPTGGGGGLTWTAVASGVDVDLHAVFALATNAAWAVGDGGTILEWDGHVWSSVSSGTTEILNDVYAVSASDVWVAGDGETLLEGSGGTWSPRTIVRTLPHGGPFPPDLTCLTVTSSGVIVIGELASGMEGYIDRFDPSTSGWSTWLADPLRAVAPADAAGVFLISARFADASLVYQASASFSQILISGDPTMTSGLWANGTEAWTTGNHGQVYHATSITTVSDTMIDTGAGVALRAIWGVASASGATLWAVGDGGTIVSGDGATWSVATPSAENLADVHGSGTNDVWAVGAHGTILHGRP